MDFTMCYWMRLRSIFLAFMMFCVFSFLILGFRFYDSLEMTAIYRYGKYKSKAVTNIIELEGILKLKRKQSMRKEIPHDFYDFLYGKEFREALRRAHLTPKKKIIYWHPPGDLSMTEELDLPWECGECEVRRDLKMINDTNTEAVVILYDSLRPAKRDPKHYWIWRTGEAPPSLSRSNAIEVAENVKYNMTFTYRRDSDFYSHYGDSLIQTKTSLTNPLKNKDRLALIAVSDCDAVPGAKVRMQYLKKMIKAGFQLTVIGSCSGFFNPHYIAPHRTDQLLQFISRHKFYFAIENSFHCRDYVTEKFFRTLEANVVPVVWGATRETYERYVPSSGFIFIEDFPSVRGLVDYLDYLDKNDSAYLEYFTWRGARQNHPEYRMRYGSCQICRFLHGIRVDDAYKVPPRDLQKTKSFISDHAEKKVVSSLKEWWEETENPSCTEKNIGLDEHGRIVIKM